MIYSFLALIFLAGCQKPAKLSVAIDNFSELSIAPMGADTYNDELKLQLKLLDLYFEEKLPIKLQENTKKALMAQSEISNIEEKALSQIYLTLPELLMPEKIDKDWLKAKFLFFKRRFIESSILLSEILKNQPNFYQARNFKARCLFFLGNPHLAIKELEFIVNDKKVDQENFLDALYLVGAMIHELSDNDLLLLKKAYDSWQKYLNKGENIEIKKEIVKSLADIKARIALIEKPFIDIFEPQKNYSALKNKALQAFKDNDLKISSDIIDKILQKNYDKTLILLKARILFKNSLISSSEKLFSELAKKYPSFVELWHYKGMFYMLQGQIAKAIESWERVLKLNYNYGFHYDLKQKIAKAKQMLSV